jgi:signal peptidase I
MSASPEPSAVPSRMITPERKLEALQHVNRRRDGLNFLWDWAKILTISIGLFLVLRTFVVEAFKIPSGSMERTLLVGDFLLVNKLVYGAEVPGTGRRLPAMRTPQRGDVIVFEWPKDRSKSFVKRLVGLPGDTLAMRDGILIRNGVALAEPYVSHSDPEADPVWDEFRWQSDFLVRTADAAVGYHPSRNNWGPLVVPQMQYFVLGDNRDNSLDSRYWGFVPDSLLRGRPEVVYFSFAPDSAADLAWLTHVRWTRLGERVH